MSVFVEKQSDEYIFIFTEDPPRHYAVQMNMCSSSRHPPHASKMNSCLSWSHLPNAAETDIDVSRCSCLPMLLKQTRNCLQGSIHSVCQNE
jgi:hypothetical protein